MTEEARKGREEFLNQKVKIIFNDGEHYTLKSGICLSISDGLIYLLTDNGQKHAISLNAVIRMEKL